MWKKVLIYGGIICGFLLSLVIFAFTLNPKPSNTMSRGTTINNIDVGGMSSSDAYDLISHKIAEDSADATITLVGDDYEWKYTGDSIKITSNTRDVINRQQNRNIFTRLSTRKANENVSVGYQIKDIDGVADEVISDVDQPLINASLSLDQNNEFVLSPEQDGKSVNRQSLVDELLKVQTNKDTVITVPIDIEEASVKLGDLKKATVKQATYSTNYSKSSEERKNNISLAVSKLNGVCVQPGEEFSFNGIVGERTPENGYKEANVIQDGMFVKGAGGGVCQVSTTLYNALIRAGVNVSEVHKHSLAVSYVPLAFDAMVSWGSSDLKFINDTNLPIFIKGYCDGEKVTFEVYGDTKQANENIVARAEYVGAIPHPGDKVVVDEAGEYADKIMFKGEYLRIKYPQEGYESKAYLDYYRDGVKVDEKLIRHEKYQPQEGLVIEGAEDLPEGMTLPKNNVSIIPPQSSTSTDKTTAESNITTKNPTIYNP